MINIFMVCGDLFENIYMEVICSGYQLVRKNTAPDICYGQMTAETEWSNAAGFSKKTLRFKHLHYLEDPVTLPSDVLPTEIEYFPSEAEWNAHQGRWLEQPGAAVVSDTITETQKLRVMREYGGVLNEAGTGLDYSFGTITYRITLSDAFTPQEARQGMLEDHALLTLDEARSLYGLNTKSVLYKYKGDRTRATVADYSAYSPLERAYAGYYYLGYGLIEMGYTRVNFLQGFGLSAGPWMGSETFLAVKSYADHKWAESKKYVQKTGEPDIVEQDWGFWCEAGDLPSPGDAGMRLTHVRIVDALKPQLP